MIYLWLLAVFTFYDWGRIAELSSSDFCKCRVLTTSGGTILFLLGCRMFSHGGEKLRIIVFYDVFEVLERMNDLCFWLKCVNLFYVGMTTFSFIPILSAYRAYTLARR